MILSTALIGQFERGGFQHGCVRYIYNDGDDNLSTYNSVNMTQALIQSTFGQPGNFELLVLQNSHPSKNLEHYFRDNNPAGTKQWNPSPAQTISSNDIITSHATSPGAIIQSTFGNPG